ncbi:Phosphatidylinositol-4-phosphate 5-kinase [Rhodotorula toruloides]
MPGQAVQGREKWIERLHLHGHGGRNGHEAEAVKHEGGDKLEVPDGTSGQQAEDGDDGLAKEVEGFKDQPYQQDHTDQARMKLRDWKEDMQDRLEERGWRTPTHERDEQALLVDPRVANQLERKPDEALDGADDRTVSLAPSSTRLNGSSSFYSAASEVGGAASIDSRTVPPRSASPESLSSVSDILATPQLAPSQLDAEPSTSGGADAFDRLPVAYAPGFVVTNSRLVPLGDGRAPPSEASSSSPTRSAHSAVPVHEVVRPTSSHPDLQQQQGQISPPASPRTKSRLAPSSSPRQPRNSSLHPPPAATQGYFQLSPQQSTRPSSPRRSLTTDLPTLLPSPPLGVGPASATSLAVSSRRLSSASGHLAPLQLPQRSQTYSPPLAAPASLGQHQYAYPQASTSAAPYGSGTPASPPTAGYMDDVESSIAAQAEVIRRKRQEKRLEAEKAERDREREKAGLAPPVPAVSEAGRGDKGEKSVGGLLGVATPGGMLKRRSTRMGSGSSAQEAPRSPGPGARARQASEGAERGQDGTADAGASAAEHAAAASGSAAKARAAGTGGEDELGAGVLVGNLIGQDHANYVLMYNMLTGIRIGVSRCQAKARRPLTDADYTARHKFSFDIVGNELTPSVKYDFKFKDYAPWVFRELREYFYLDPSDYLVSLTAKYILSELGSPGKSGSFFYFSRDYRFIIKTIHHTEHKFLRRILKEYHEHVKKNPHTLLSRFYGLHRVKLPHGKKIHFVIMNNLFPPHRDIHETYDLKGSSIGRLYPEEKAKQNPHAVLKDLNWVQRQRQIALGPEKKALFEEQLRRDTELLQRLGIMDYSLLTGIHNGVRGNSDNLREEKLSVFQPENVKVSRKPTQVKRDADASALRKAVQRSDPRALGGKHELPEHENSEKRMFLFYQDEGGMRATGDNNEDLGVIYYLGIIDILTPYNCVKRIEHFWKGLKHNKHMISAVPPREYGDRFLAFIKSSIRGNDISIRPQMFEHEPKHDAKQEKPPVNVSSDDEKAQRQRNDGRVEMSEKSAVAQGKVKAQ